MNSIDAQLALRRRVVLDWMPVRRKITALAVGAIAATCGIPATASAAEPGFTVDPQTPAGVEYQIPLDSARGQGGGGHNGGGHLGGGGGNSSGGGGGGGTSSGGGTGSSSGSGSSALFGAGISPATAGSGGSPGSNVSGAGRGSDTGSSSGAGGSGRGSRSLPSALTASADYSSTGPVAGIIAAILLVGGGFGLFLRLRARRPRKIFS
jgi:hypothetical protein